MESIPIYNYYLKIKLIQSANFVSSKLLRISSKLMIFSSFLIKEISHIAIIFGIMYFIYIQYSMKTDRNDDSALLEEGLALLGIEATDQILSLLIKYTDEIELFNPAYGLVKVRDRRELIVKHIFDSLAPINIIRRLSETKQIADISSGAGLQGKPTTTRIADIGSGAGLPGIPLAICLPDSEFTLVERMGRRAGFLRDVIAVLGISNVTVEEAEMEKLAANPAARFDLIAFRAFKPLEGGMLKKLVALLAPGGTLTAYKGRLDSINEEMAGLVPENGKGGFSVNWDIFPLEVPFLEEERHLVVVRKRSN